MPLLSIDEAPNAPGAGARPWTIPGLDVPVFVRRSQRARRFTLKVDEARRNVVLTVPARGNLEEARRFLSKHIAWLEARLAAMPRPVPFTHGAVVPLRGLTHELCFAGSSRVRGVVWIEADEPARDRPLICVAGKGDHAPRRLADWLKREARKDIAARVGWHAGRLGLAPKRITVRDQATRWGSCSSTGALSFSWRLVLAPHFVLDYVSAHEVAHLREMNHSRAFWRLVQDTMPRTDEARRWLRRNGAELHRYGAES